MSPTLVTMPPVAELRLAIQRVEAEENRGAVTVIGNDKGGVGKSVVCDGMANEDCINNDAPLDDPTNDEKITTIKQDFDPNPGGSQKYITFEIYWNEYHHIKPVDRMQRMDDDPENRTIIRFLAHPEFGTKEMSLTFAFGEVLKEIGSDAIPRIEGHTLDLSTMYMKTVAAHGINPDRIGNMALYPNNGDIQDHLDAVIAARKAANSRYHKYELFGESLKIQRDMGLIPRRARVWGDTPGERGYTLKAALTYCDVVVIPMSPTQLSLAGTKMTISDAKQIRRQRADPLGRPWIYVIPNMMENTPAERTFMNRALPFIRQAGVYLSESWIPYSQDYHDAGLSGAVEFFYHGYEAAGMAIRDNYLALFGR